MCFFTFHKYIELHLHQRIVGKMQEFRNPVPAYFLGSVEFKHLHQEIQKFAPQNASSRKKILFFPNHASASLSCRAQFFENCDVDVFHHFTNLLFLFKHLYTPEMPLYAIIIWLNRAHELLHCWQTYIPLWLGVMSCIHTRQ